ncbi:hypothetical protein HZH66_012045 [Vespula vulgaris]|uniref:Uncharacterized protein n=1 Tax=Vespula vulgaris TaxID=7454 RepID=A0A834JD91_VESVU|nr:hypothetical protein HZH66_012045 [Vespula vulgaris]
MAGNRFVIDSNAHGRALPPLSFSSHQIGRHSSSIFGSYPIALRVGSAANAAANAVLRFIRHIGSTKWNT